MTTSMTWNRLRNLVKNRDKSICYHCKKVASDGHCDHLIPLSKGGTDAIDNLVWSCKKCNFTKGNKEDFVSANNPFRFSSEPILESSPYPILNNNIWRVLLLKAIGFIIPPYPEYSVLGFSNRDYYWNRIKKMRQNKLKTWLREVIWTIPMDAQDVIDWVNTVNEIESYTKRVSKL